MNRVYLLCGPSLSGKTVLREEIVARLGVRSISFDEINSERGLPFGANGLVDEWAVTLDVALKRLSELLAAGESVVVDDTFCYRWLRDRFCSLAAQFGATPVILYLAIPGAVLHQRYAMIQASGARPLLSISAFATHLAAFEAPSSQEPALIFSTHGGASEWLRAGGIVPF